MALRAPLRMPVELTGDGRWFRPSADVGQDGMRLDVKAPDELSGSTPVRVLFHLPGDAVPIVCRGRFHEVILEDDEHQYAERREIELLNLDEADRARIEGYVNERLGLI